MHIIASPLNAPRMEDGSSWPFVLLNDDGSQGVYADSWTGIAAYVIGNPDYAEIDDPEEAWMMRYQAAIVLAANLRGRLSPDVDDLFAMDLTDEDILTFVFEIEDLRDDADSGDLLLPMGDNPQLSRLAFKGLDNGREWKFSFPFVGLTTDYQPYTHIPPIIGNVLYIDPENDRTFIMSLVEANQHLAEAELPPIIEFGIQEGDLPE